MRRSRCGDELDMKGCVGGLTKYGKMVGPRLKGWNIGGWQRESSIMGYAGKRDIIKKNKRG